MANFVNTTLMDGYAGGPHITEKQSGLANQAIIGEADYVLEGGPNTKAFEQEMADFYGCKFTVGLNSGTDEPLGRVASRSH